MATEIIDAGTWVDIWMIILDSSERAPQVPEDTAQVPLEMKVKGFLNEAARIGDEVEITTPAGHVYRGKLIEDNPAYEHNFGAPIPELMTIGRELRELLQQGGEQ